MRSLRAQLPSPAMVVAIAALVMAMAGTGYAALQLPKNSVGTKQIKKNAVTTQKIKKNAVSAAKIKKNAVNGVKVKNKSLTGADIDLNKLGTVPSATNAAVADLANSIPPAEPTRYVGTGGQPGFESGSSNVPGEAGVEFPDVGFYKDHEGIVHLTGIALVGESGPLGRIFTLPPGYRPASGQIMIVNVFCVGLGSGSCETDDEGDEQTYQRLLVVGSNTVLEGTDLSGAIIAPPGTAISLDGVTFRAES